MPTEEKETPALITEQLYATQMANAAAQNAVAASEEKPPETETPETAPSPEPAEDRLIIGGVDLTGVQLSEEQVEALEKAALRQQDYTKKTQKIAEQKRDLDLRAKKADIAEKLEAYFEKDPEALRILSARMMGDRQNGNGTIPSIQTNDLPDNWEELTPSQQTNWFIQKSASLVASQISPELQAIRRELDAQKKLSADETAFYEAHPEAAELDESDPLVELTDKLYAPDKGVSLVDAYEEAARLLGRQTEKIEEKVIASKKRAAASLAKPANSSNDDGAPDPKSFKKDTDYYDAVKNWSLNQMRRI